MALSLQDTYKTIQKIIEGNFQTIMEQNPQIYRGYSLIVSNEQDFVKIRTYTPHTIYVNIRFQEAKLTFGQTVIPVGLEILSEQNGLNVAQSLIFTFASEYNLKYNQEGTVLQQYETPTAFSKFNEIGNGFRAYFNCRGQYLIAPDAIPVTSIIYSWTDPTITDSDKTVSEEWFPLSFTWDLAIQLDSQAFFKTDANNLDITDNITESIAKIGTFSISFNLYQTDLAVFNKLLDMINGLTADSHDSDFNGIDTPFDLTINFKNGKTIHKKFKLSHATSAQRVADIPVISFVFTI